VFEDALARFEGQVEALELGVFLFQFIHHAQRLQVVLEAAVLLHAGVEHVLADMAERRVAEVVGQRQGFRQVFVQAQHARQRAADLGDLQAVGQAGAEQVALVVDEHLGLVFQAAEGGGMHDAVAVALEFGTRCGGRFRMAAALGFGGFCGIRGCVGLREFGHAYLGVRHRRAMSCSKRWISDSGTFLPAAISANRATAASTS
jgi:hypothetical protein